MENHILIIGLNDKETKKQEISNEVAKNIIKKSMASQNIIGYTMQVTDRNNNILGGYMHNDRTYIEENSIIIYLFCVENVQICNLISDLCISLNQECITDVNLKANVSFKS